VRSARGATRSAVGKYRDQKLCLSKLFKNTVVFNKGIKLVQSK
jgi:hypothetical protein